MPQQPAGPAGHRPPGPDPLDGFIETFDRLLSDSIATRIGENTSNLGEKMALAGRIAPGAIKKSLAMAVRESARGRQPGATDGDRIFWFVDFVSSHARLPLENRFLNDALYSIKSNDALLDPLRQFTTDKEFLKIFVRSELGEIHNVPSMRIIRSIEELRKSPLPENCFAKPTHLSGRHLLIRRAGQEHIREIESWFRMNHHSYTRELNYLNLTPKVIVEPVLETEGPTIDFKIFCHEGQPKLVQTGLISPAGEDRRRYYTPDWRELVPERLARNSLPQIGRPRELAQMLEIATTLSKRLSLVRVDLYSTGNRVLVGELTHCHMSARDRFGGLGFEAALSRQIFG